MNNTVELRTLTPELGEFTITGALQDVELAAMSFRGMKQVSSSTFDRVATGKPMRSLQLGKLSLAFAV